MEERFMGIHDFHLHRYAMQHLVQVLQLSPERLAYGLMAEANAQYPLCGRITQDEFGHDASILGQSRPG